MKNRKLSATTNVRKLSFLLEKIGLSVDEVEEMARSNPSELRRKLNRYATDAKAVGRLDSYLGKLFTGLRAYFAFRRLSFDQYPELEATAGESIASEKVPTQEHLGLVLERLTARGRVIALLIAHAGVRPQVIGAYEGARGLVLGDLPELVFSSTIRFEKVPFVIRGRAKLSKTGRSWTTFGSRQLATSIISYLTERRERGEDLSAESPLVTHNEVRGAAARSSAGARAQLGFLTTTHVVLELANVLHALAPRGTRARPYVLRAFFSTALLRAGVDRDLREALMSHDTGVAGAYNVGKPWSDDLLEKARREYDRAAECLETTGRPKSDVKADLLATLADAIEEATGKRSDRTLRGDDLLRAIKEALGTGADPKSGKSTKAIRPGKRRGEQRVIDTEATGAYLEAGWVFKAPLNGSKAIVEWEGARE